MQGTRRSDFQDLVAMVGPYQNIQIFANNQQVTYDKVLHTTGNLHVRWDTFKSKDWMVRKGHTEGNFNCSSGVQSLKPMIKSK